MGAHMHFVMRFTGLAFLAAFLALTSAQCQQQESKPRVSSAPLTSDELAIYAAILHGWMNDGKQRLNLSVLTIPLNGEDAKSCTQLPLETADPTVVHRFRQEDLAVIGSSSIQLVDPDAQSREIEKNDPGRAIRNGTSVDDAVKNGFAHGLITFSEIRFDKNHEHAIVWFGFRCGGLCGNGGTSLMVKKNGKWREQKECSIWMSRLRPGSTLRAFAS